MKIANILFDLDGTLTDSKLGITKSIQYALERLGRSVLQADDLLWCIGPNLRESFKKILKSDDDTAGEAVTFYREYYKDKGKFENDVYSGIPEVLEELNEEGFNLFVVTSKPYVFAIEIVTHFDLLRFFKRVYGSELDGKFVDKVDLIAHMLRAEKISAGETVIVGDNSNDIIGARKNGIFSIGVTYGYGTREDLIESGADFIVDSPEGIFKIVKELMSM
jgi:phosphoglycolate phosphatase